jgi:hypothetical protein
VFGRAALAGALVALGLGCHRAAPASRFPSARALIERVRETRRCSRGLSGEGVIDYIGDDGRIRAKTLYVVARPKRLRFDVLSPLGGVLSTLTSDGRSFAFLDAQNRRFTRGRADECNVEQALRVPVPPQALGELLTGEPPTLVHEPGDATLEWQSGAYAIEIRSLHQARQRLVLVPRDADWDEPWQRQRLRLLEVEVAQRGQVLYRVELGDYRAARRAEPRVDPDGLLPDAPPSGPPCGAEVPGKVHFEVPGAGRDIVFSQSHVRHNPPLTPESFRQPIPEGVAVLESSCGS